MKILISLPLFKRDWILGEWFRHIEAQTIPLSDLGFMFELGPDDKATHQILWDWHAKHPEVQCFDARIHPDPEMKHKTHPENRRTWAKEDYDKMSRLRNSLLERAVVYNPDRYFSLDSDMLLENPETLEILYRHTENRSAVAPLAYMWPEGKRFPNIMTWDDERHLAARRIISIYPKYGIFPADVIMGAVMMNRETYINTRYRYHKQGEDIGWSQSAAEHSLDLWLDPEVYCPHIMHKSMIDNYMSLGDPRSTNKRRLNS